MDAREALNAANGLIADGLAGVEIVDEKGNPYDLIDLERLTHGAEQDARREAEI